MYRLIRYYNQNRKKIWTIIAIVVFAIIIIHILDDIAKEQKSPNIEGYNTTEQTSVQSNYNYSIMSDKQISSSKSAINNKLIEQFIQYCNNGEVENAYNLLTNECKERLYPTLQDFINIYHSQVFKTTKTYSIQSWYSEDVNTYKIRILNDMLSTGTYDNSEIIEDYYTIIESEQGSKLNINGYIGRIEINKFKKYANIAIALLSKDVYMDYEIYKIKIQNGSDKNIMIDSKERTTTSYLTGENGTMFSAYMFELANQDLIIEKESDSVIEIKFNKMYNPEVQVRSITFSDIVMDYQQYQNTENKNEYTNRINITIDI